jgi:hypothetical protein
MIPGWYDDPWSETWLRWWDGQNWSGHVIPKPGAAQPMHPRVAEVVAERLERERKWAPRALFGLGVVVIFFAVVSLLDGIVYAHTIRHAFQNPSRNPDGTVRFSFASSVPQYVGLLGWLPQIPLMLWLKRAAHTAREAGLPARRSPSWGIWGFVVPVVSLWFPYLVAVDCLPPGDERRRLVGNWWGWWLAQSFSSLVIAVTAIVSTAVSAPIAVISLVCPALMLFYGRKMIKAISAAHEDLLPR